MFDISKSGNGFQSDGIPLNLFEDAKLQEVKIAVFERYESLVENFQLDSSEPNPYIMDPSDFVKDYFFGSHYKNEIEEFFEEARDK